MRYADGGGLTAAGRERREVVRMQAAGLFEQGIKPPEVAQRLRVSRKSAYQWYQLWRDGGEQTLASRGPGGSRCRLSPRCLEKLAAYLEQGPAAHGWVEDQVWTAARVATLSVRHPGGAVRRVPSRPDASGSRWRRGCSVPGVRARRPGAGARR
ncbi:helix-turn-helix domain-containing protein [Streptomyces sp. NPDC006971]|uniref:helix-turn-helix domain-containing protein n=1 Tax=Streptomyces sp. NPDC006971 TaxID=3154784 RepID=UPI0033D632E4